MDIKEISSKVTNSFGGYGAFILIGAVALVFISNLSNNSDDETLQAPTGYSAYPDSVTNANVIIGEVNDHTTAEIKNMGDSLNEAIGNVNDNVTNTGNNITDKISSSTETITGKIDTKTEEIMKDNAENNTSLINQINTNQQAYNKLLNDYNNLKKQNTSLSSSLKTTQEKLTKTNKDLTNTKSSLKSSKSLVKSLQKSLNKLAKKTGYKGKVTVTGTANGVFRG